LVPVQVEEVDPLAREFWAPLASSKKPIFMVQFWFQVEDVDQLGGELWAPLASSDKLSDSHHGSEVQQKKNKRCKINKKDLKFRISI
jgi:hypothetical protein